MSYVLIFADKFQRCQIFYTQRLSLTAGSMNDVFSLEQGESKSMRGGKRGEREKQNISERKEPEDKISTKHPYCNLEYTK